MLITNQEELDFACAWLKDVNNQLYAMTLESKHFDYFHPLCCESFDLAHAIGAYHADQLELEASRRAYLKGAQSPHAR